MINKKSYYQINMSKTNPLNVLKLSQEELEQFIKIHHTIIPNRTKNFEVKDINKRSTLPLNIHVPILDKAVSILGSIGINNVDKNEYYIEFHQRNCGFEKKKHQWSHWHTDDHSSINSKVYSVLFYLRKDVTVKGGDLDYKINKTIYTHKVKPGDIVQFRGDLQHMPQSTNGFGCRDLIVCFIKRT